MRNYGTSSTITGLMERGSLAREFLLLSFFGALSALSAQISIHLPFTPVPVTPQVFVVILSGLILGSRLAMLSQLEYLVLGMAGLPIFADFKGGAMALMTPSGGYLIGFIFAAYLVGLIRERISAKGFGGVLAVAVGIAAIYVVGVCHLALIALGGDLKKAFLLGAVPFIGIDIVKGMLALGIAGAATRISGR